MGSSQLDAISIISQSEARHPGAVVERGLELLSSKMPPRNMKLSYARNLLLSRISPQPIFTLLASRLSS